MSLKKTCIKYARIDRSLAVEFGVWQQWAEPNVHMFLCSSCLAHILPPIWKALWDIFTSIFSCRTVDDAQKGRGLEHRGPDQNTPLHLSPNTHADPPPPNNKTLKSSIRIYNSRVTCTFGFHVLRLSVHAFLFKIINLLFHIFETFKDSLRVRLKLLVINKRVIIRNPATVNSRTKFGSKLPFL